MEAKVNYTIVGLSVILISAALISTALWLSVGFNQKSYNIYAVFLKEAATGLSEEAPVRFNGVKVGYVRQISLDHNNPNQVILLLNIEEGTPVTVGTTATLMSQGITGISYVGLSAVGSNLTPLKATDDFPYPIIPARPSLFNQLDKAIREVSVSVSSVSEEIKRVFDKENAANIKTTVANLNVFTETLAKNTEHINQTLVNVDQLSKNLMAVSQEFPQLVADIKSTAKHFNVMSESIAEAGNQVSKTMKNGTTAIDKLSQQTVPAVTQLVQKLDMVANNIEQISRIMRRNPSVIIRGSTPAKPGPGER